MIEKGVINRLQLWLLIINFLLGGSLLLTPGAVASVSNKDGWISLIVASLIGIIVALIIVTLTNRFPEYTMIEILQVLLGNKLGKVIGFFYAYFFLHLSALLMRDATDFLTIVSLTATPRIAISITAGLLLYYTIYHGVEVIGRTTEIYAPIAALSTWLVIFLVIPKINLTNIYPIFPQQIKPILKAAYPVIGFPYTELIVFSMILPFVNTRKHIKKVFITGTLLAGIVLTVVVLFTLLTLNARPTGFSLFATYNMARLINIGNFLTRIEEFLAISFLLTIFVKMMVTFYGGLLGMAQVFGLTHYRPFIFPLLVIVIVLSEILNRNIAEVIEVAGQVWPALSIMLGMLIPLILLVLSYFKKNQR